MGLERAHDFHSFLSTVNTLNQLVRIEYSTNGLKFRRVHNKMENVWTNLHPLELGEATANLGDYSTIQTDAQMIDALKQGFVMA